MKKFKARHCHQRFALPVLLTLTTSALHAQSILDTMDRVLRSSYETPEYDEVEIDEPTQFAPYSPADSDLGDQVVLRSHSKRAPFYIIVYTNL